MRLTPGTVAFACHEKACAPPPAGKGGSSKSPTGRLVKNKSIKNVDDARLLESLGKLHGELHTGEGLRAFSDTKRSLVERGMKARMIVHELQKRGHPKPECKSCALTGNETYTGPMGDAIAKYKAAQKSGDIVKATEAAVEWAGARAAQRKRQVGDIKTPDINDILSRSFMGPVGAKKGRQPFYTGTKEETEAWFKANKTPPRDDKPRVTRYH